MRSIFIIWQKELRDTIRDKRTLISSIVLPMVLMPLLIVGMFKLIEYEEKKTEEKVVKIAIENADTAPDLIEILRNDEKIEIVEMPDDIQKALKDNLLDLVVTIPPSFDDQIANQETATIEAKKNSLNLYSGTALAKIQIAIQLYNNTILADRFSDLAVAPSILNLVTIEAQEVASDQELGGFGLSMLLPMFIVMWAIVGGQYAAIDVSAGEKERKTLESLLLTPVKRLHIVIGKYLTVVTTALISVIVSLGSIYVSILVFGFGLTETATANSQTQELSLDFSLDLRTFIILFVVSLLLVFLFSATLISIAIFAKSYKEAQSYIGPAYLVIILPITILNVIPGFKAGIGFFFLPAINAILLFKEVLVGTFDTWHILVTFLSLILYAVISILIAAKIYSKEGILFRS